MSDLINSQKIDGVIYPENDVIIEKSPEGLLYISYISKEVESILNRKLNISIRDYSLDDRELLFEEFNENIDDLQESINDELINENIERIFMDKGKQRYIERGNV